MIQTEHCDLCEFPKRDLKKGLTCGLTNKKPDFEVSCPDLKFSNSLKEYLPELLNQIVQLEKRKASIYLNLGLFAGIGLLILFGSYPYLIQNFKQTFDPEFSYLNWNYFLSTLLLSFVGIRLILMGFWPFNNYRKELKELQSEKSKINMVLKNYGIKMETLMNLEKK
ncbi:hypothetical protein FF125_14380 [Aureibaculum algae]|uniref:Uncharacterized protein n=1 Tax=Aureibaculum algae TaxID=2584122 RepID=A0A5B7TRJ2_9FLAO|nr:hypothetical protein [Aureibaculum algae]QCX39569.1 hypothetical protein FF125_14380 [Aureibaculum algae]